MGWPSSSPSVRPPRSAFARALAFCARLSILRVLPQVTGRPTARSSRTRSTTTSRWAPIPRVALSSLSGAAFADRAGGLPDQDDRDGRQRTFKIRLDQSQRVTSSCHHNDVSSRSTAAAARRLRDCNVRRRGPPAAARRRARRRATRRLRGGSGRRGDRNQTRNQTFRRTKDGRATARDWWRRTCA